MHGMAIELAGMHVVRVCRHVAFDAAEEEVM